MNRELLVIIFVLLVRSSLGQQFTDLYGDYLGQIPPGDTPVVFAPGIISRNYFEHSAAIFSSDGNEVYWCSREPALNGGKANLWLMTRINKRWTKPAILTPFGDSVSSMDPFLSMDGKRLYFSSDGVKPKKNGVSQVKNTESWDTWFIEKQGNGWSKPQSISPVINSVNSQEHVTFNNVGTVYFSDFKWNGEKWTYDILRSRCINGNYLRPDTLPACINSISSEDWTPFIAPNDSYLIFSSRRQKDDGDLYISFHDIPTDSWSEPINMGEPINSMVQEAFPTVSPDGKYLFFIRSTKNNSMDIFWASAMIIDRLREKFIKNKQ